MEQATRDAVAVRCTAVDDAQRFGTSVYFPHRLVPLDGSRPFDMSLSAVSHGAVTVGLLSYSEPVRIETGDQETAYEVNIPLVGSVESWSGPDHVVASSVRAVVFRPYGATAMQGFGRNRPLLGLKLDRVALEAQLADLVGKRVRGPVDLASSLDLSAGRGSAWWAVARSVVELFAARDDGMALLNNELVMRPLTQSLLTGFLHVVEHPYLADVLDRPSKATVPAVLRRAQAYMEEHVAEPLTVTEVAAAVGSSVRGLQVGFQQHLQRTPMEHLRELRLRRAHTELINADPDHSSVAEIAHRWGFTHLGRFAARYRAAYGQTPSEALGAGR
ncbi:AraC family transcriptional regulator [Amycolatopsis ultiminotia]|uniref:AraC family transcriptional regulator n=1 Tax=Amycolatopsis ultiminotia TaxID=543629 RepID=A0ABP6YP17_9PSEU